MPHRLTFLAVEGQHDAAFIGRLLRGAEFTLIKWKDKDSEKPDDPFLETAFSRFVPKDFPQENNLLARVAIPFFWQKADHVIALRPAEGETKLISSACSAVRTIRPDVYEAVGIILDADNRGAPGVRLEGLQRALAEDEKRFIQSAGFTLPDALGSISAGPPKCGVFIMPDNASAGTLEDILLDCASTNYPDLRAHAGNYLKAIDRSVLSVRDLDEIGVPAGERKAQVGIIGSVLKPGKAVQVSISDNRWLDTTTKELPRVAAVRRFLRDLLGEAGI